MKVVTIVKQDPGRYYDFLQNEKGVIVLQGTYMGEG